MKKLARITGAFYLRTIVFGVLGLSSQGRFLVPGDAAATAAKIFWLLVFGVDELRWKEQASG